MEGRARTDQIKQIQTALAGIDEAQRLTGKRDQNAKSRAGDVAKIIADVLDAVAKP